MLDAEPPRVITDTYAGDAVVAAYSVVHGRDGAPEWGLVVCDLADGTRAYGKVFDAGLLDTAEHTELVGQTLHLTPTELEGPMGAVTANVATS